MSLSSKFTRAVLSSRVNRYDRNFYRVAISRRAASRTSSAPIPKDRSVCQTRDVTYSSGHPDKFVDRHIGPRNEDIEKMWKKLGVQVCK